MDRIQFYKGMLSEINGSDPVLKNVVEIIKNGPGYSFIKKVGIWIEMNQIYTYNNAETFYRTS